MKQNALSISSFSSSQHVCNEYGCLQDKHHPKMLQLVNEMYDTYLKQTIYQESNSRLLHSKALHGYLQLQRDLQALINVTQSYNDCCFTTYQTTLCVLSHLHGVLSSNSSSIPLSQSDQFYSHAAQSTNQMQTVRQQYLAILLHVIATLLATATYQQCEEVKRIVFFWQSLNFFDSYSLQKTFNIATKKIDQRMHTLQSSWFIRCMQSIRTSLRLYNKHGTTTSLLLMAFAQAWSIALSLSILVTAYIGISLFLQQFLTKQRTPYPKMFAMIITAFCCFGCFWIVRPTIILPCNASNVATTVTGLGLHFLVSYSSFKNYNTHNKLLLLLRDICTLLCVYIVYTPNGALSKLIGDTVIAICTGDVSQAWLIIVGLWYSFQSYVMLTYKTVTMTVMLVVQDNKSISDTILHACYKPIPYISSAPVQGWFETQRSYQTKLAEYNQLYATYVQDLRNWKAISLRSPHVLYAVIENCGYKLAQSCIEIGVCDVAPTTITQPLYVAYYYFVRLIVFIYIMKTILTLCTIILPIIPSISFLIQAFCEWVKRIITLVYNCVTLRCLTEQDSTQERYLLNGLLSSSLLFQQMQQSCQGYQKLVQTDFLSHLDEQKQHIYSLS